MRSGKIFIRRLAPLGAVLVLVGTAQAQGTISYFRPETPISFAPVPGFESQTLDLDHNGIADFLVSSYITSVLAANSVNRMLGKMDWDGGFWLVPLAEGDPITVSPVAGEWVQRASISACAWPFGCTGSWLGLTAYAGVEFRIGDSLHHGWIQIQHFEASNAGRILGWAYETRPGVPILAGTIPEPSTWALLIGGGVLMVWFRRKRNEKRG